MSGMAARLTVSKAPAQAFPIRRVFPHRLVDDRDRGRGACQATPWLLAGSSALGRVAEPTASKEEARPKPGSDDGDPKYAELELGCGVPHRLGGAPRACGVTGQSVLSKACELVNAEGPKMPGCAQCDALRLHLKRPHVARHPRDRATTGTARRRVLSRHYRRPSGRYEALALQNQNARRQHTGKAPPPR